MASRRAIFGMGLGIAGLVILLDQLSKIWILATLAPLESVHVTPFFNLVLVWNRGISFGLFNSDSSLNVWLLPAIAVVVVVFLSIWLWRSDSRWIGLSIGLIIGGALGNVVDRLRLGAVVDFLDFYLGTWHWPAFNLADSAITVGALFLIAESLFARPDAHKHKGPIGNKRNDGP